MLNTPELGPELTCQCFLLRDFFPLYYSKLGVILGKTSLCGVSSSVLTRWRTGYFEVFLFHRLYSLKAF